MVLGEEEQRFQHRDQRGAHVLAIESMRTCNNRGAEAHTCIPNYETSVYIFLSKEQGTNTTKVQVKLRSLIFILPLLLLSTVLQSLTASRYGQDG